MSLKERAKVRSKRKGETCSVELLRRTVSKADWAEVVEALADPLITASAIGAVLREDGHEIGDQALARHRRGVCACPR